MTSYSALKADIIPFNRKCLAELTEAAACEFEAWPQGNEDDQRIRERFMSEDFGQQAMAWRTALADLYRSKPQLFVSFSKQPDLLETTIDNLSYAEEFFEKAGLMVGEAVRRLTAVQAQTVLQGLGEAATKAPPPNGALPLT
jgi:hypothetical protein